MSPFNDADGLQPAGRPSSGLRSTRFSSVAAQPFPAVHLGIDVAGFLASAARVQDEARRPGPEGLAAFDPGLFPVMKVVA